MADFKADGRSKRGRRWEVGKEVVSVSLGSARRGGARTGEQDGAEVLEGGTEVREEYLNKTTGEPYMEKLYEANLCSAG